MIRSPLRVALAYVLLVGGPLLALIAILRVKVSPAAAVAPSLPAAGHAAVAAAGLPQPIAVVLAVTVVVLACRACGALFARLGQPRVVGDMFAGIMLGPSVLGLVAPGVSQALFSPVTVRSLEAVSQLGLILFMFLVGLRLAPTELKSQGHVAVLTSHVSIAVPFVAGAVLALYLYPRLSPDNVSFATFALFIGTAMSVTAFPVLARILTERHLLETRLGVTAIACAAVDDVTSWCLLAYIVAVVRSGGGLLAAAWTVGGLVAFVLAMIVVVRPVLRRIEPRFSREGATGEGTLALVLPLILAAALVTDLMGAHALFGPFLLGAVMPKEPRLVRDLSVRLETVVVVLLLPLFFALTGLRTRIGFLDTPQMWLTAAAILGVAVFGKLGGSAAAAWLSGLPGKEAVLLGVLMNTRGLVELVVLNVGLDAGVISPPLFSMLVFMALATTAMTTPLIDVIGRSRLPDIYRVWREAVTRGAGVAGQ